MAIGLDAFGVTFLVRELRTLLTGGTIDRISLIDDRVLEIATSGDRRSCTRFLADPALPLICVTDRPRSGSCLPGLPRFEEVLRGAVISDACQINLDRVVMMSVVAGRDKAYRLYFELIPPFANMFLTDIMDVILEPLFTAGTRTRRRILERGRDYAPPTTQDKIHPTEAGEYLKSLPWPENPEVLSRLILGVGPFLSREIVSRASRHGSLQSQFDALIETYRMGICTPVTFRTTEDIDRTVPRVGVAWFRPSMKGVSQIRTAATLNQAIRAVFDAFVETSKFERKKAAVTRSLAAEIRRWMKAEERARQAVLRGSEAAQFRRYAEIIIANLARVRKGTTEARLPDIYTEAKREVVIPVEPRLSPQANAEVYFKKARKAAVRAIMAEKALGEARQRLAELESLRKEALTDGVGKDRLDDIGAIVSAAVSGRRVPSRGPDQRLASLGIRPRTFVVRGGWKVFVGRSAKENDTLTHRYASPGDLWFHARQAQGSHVILKRDRKQTQVPKESIIEAASIAAYYSKARTSKHVPVAYTEKRYVRRVKKGAPGAAAVLRERVVFVDPALPAEG